MRCVRHAPSLCGLAAGAMFALTSTAAMAQTAMVDDPCQGGPAGATPTELIKPLLEPGAKGSPPAPPNPAAAAAIAQARARDWPGLCRYRAANAALTSPTKVVFMGDSITEFWAIAEPELFTGGVVDRGISAQTSPQMLLRFRNDVIALKPRIVHIMAGTNDVAGNTGPTSEADFEGTIQSMVELAQANGIMVVLASIPPAGKIGWRPEMQPVPEIRRLNAWLSAYAARKGLKFIDYYAALSSPDGAFRPDLSNDGVHPNLNGYAIMRSLAAPAISAR